MVDLEMCRARRKKKNVGLSLLLKKSRLHHSPPHCFLCRLNIQLTFKIQFKFLCFQVSSFLRLCKHDMLIFSPYTVFSEGSYFTQSLSVTDVLLLVYRYQGAFLFY